MTLVVAGFEKDGSVVFCGDSLITTKSSGISVKLTSSFRKIITLEIIVRVPDFSPDGKITRYVENTSSHRCMIAFAGSTLVSQHIINSIQGHLRRVKYTYDSGEYDYSERRQKGAHYKLIMACENNDKVENTLWDEDVFNKPDELANELLNKKFLINLFTHCIQEIIEKFHLNTNESFEPEWYASDFIVAFSCYETRQNHLATFKMDFSDSAVKLIVDEIDKNELAIIGISRYSKEIKKSYQEKKSALTTAEILFTEVIKAVKDNESADLREIGKPVVLKKFDRHRELRDQQKEWRK
ncbi:hypothetical protein [Serratia marcescens]|uniref:hypothetical protein n=1 Tax=Serratia marcescens TaxID=615 RepID=UPI0013DBC5BA|nr:hypothetical protein [Serratia marcescens]